MMGWDGMGLAFFFFLNQEIMGLEKTGGGM